MANLLGHLSLMDLERAITFLRKEVEYLNRRLDQQREYRRMLYEMTSLRDWHHAGYTVDDYNRFREEYERDNPQVDDNGA